jgi:hypothetical protein
MCDKCALIDYAIGDSIWLPCGGPASRYTGRKTPRGYSDMDHDAWTKVQELVRSLNLKQAEIDRLKDAAHSHDNSRDSFEGI